MHAVLRVVLPKTLVLPSFTNYQRAGARFYSYQRAHISHSTAHSFKLQTNYSRHASEDITPSSSAGYRLFYLILFDETIRLNRVGRKFVCRPADACGACVSVTVLNK